MKILKRLLISLVLIVTVGMVVMTSAIFLFQERIIQEFISQVNRDLNTPVKVGRIDISMWHDFPNLTVDFHDVFVEDSHPENRPLITAQSISFYVNPIAVWQGDYTVYGLRVRNGEIHLEIDKEGVDNYSIFKSSKEKGREGFISFNLRNIGLTDINMFYHEASQNQNHQFSSKKLVASFTAEGASYKTTIKGDITTRRVGIGSSTFLKNRDFQVALDVRYDREKGSLLIKPSVFNLDESQFELQGMWNPHSIDVVCTGKNTTIQTLLSLLPEGTRRRLAEYKSNGDVYFDLHVKSPENTQGSPSLFIRFGCEHTTVFHAEYSSQIKDMNAKGSFFASSLDHLSNSSLSLENITGMLDGLAFHSDFHMLNFKNPYVKFSFQGGLDMQSILNFYPIEDLDSVSGKVDIDVSFKGYPELLKDKLTVQNTFIDGSIKMQRLGFRYGKERTRFNALNGTLHFTHNDLALDHVEGKLENSDFRGYGVFKNIVSFFLFKSQPIGVEINLKSNYIDLDRLMDIGFKEEDSNYKFGLSPNLYVNINYDVNHLSYKRFKGRKIRGNLLIKNQMAALRDVTFYAMGGDFSYNGIIDTKNHSAIDVVGVFNLKNVYLDSAFYVFDNFHQSFIESRHLRGQVSAKVDLEMLLNEKLNLFPETLISNIGFTIKNGELNDFKPMQRLSKYLPEDNLNHLLFADIKNDILIENKTVYIPFMRVNSNITGIDISGTHTFDQKIDYHLVTPLRIRKKFPADHAGNVPEENWEGNSKLFLKIVGTTNEYKIVYDKQAVKRKIISDIKKEVSELKEAFRLKGKQKEQDIKVEKGDYFDWGDSTRIQDY